MSAVAVLLRADIEHDQRYPCRGEAPHQGNDQAKLARSAMARTMATKKEGAA